MTPTTPAGPRDARRAPIRTPPPAPGRPDPHAPDPYAPDPYAPGRSASGWPDRPPPPRLPGPAGGADPGGPPGGGPSAVPGPSRWRTRRAKRAFAVVGVLGLLAVVALAVVAVPVLRASKAPPVGELSALNLPIRVGLCVRPLDGPEEFTGARCGSPDSVGTVTALLPEDGPTTALRCPDTTDDAVLLPTEDAFACLVGKGTSGKGRPGLGGGVPVVGDCLSRDGTETACASPAGYQRIVARTGAVESCRAPAVTWSRLPVERAPVLCLADGPGLDFGGPGDCVQADGGRFELVATSCTAAGQQFRVLGFVRASDQCSRFPGFRYYGPVDGSLPSTRTVCFAPVR